MSERIHCNNPAFFSYFINYDYEEWDWLYTQYKELEYHLHGPVGP